MQYNPRTAIKHYPISSPAAPPLPPATARIYPYYRSGDEMITGRSGWLKGATNIGDGPMKSNLEPNSNSNQEPGWLSTYFEIRIQHCPPSLRVLVNVFRFFGFSFSGASFESDSQQDDEQSEDKSTINNNNKEKSVESLVDNSQPSSSMSVSSVQRTLSLGLNVLMILAYLSPIVLMVYAKSLLSTASDGSNSTANGTQIASLGNSNVSTQPLSPLQAMSIKLYKRFIAYDMRLFDNENGNDPYGAPTGENSSSSPMSDLKPILRYIIESMTYVMILDVLINLIVNLVFGGRLLRQLTTIPQVRFEDHGKVGPMFSDEKENQGNQKDHEEEAEQSHHYVSLGWRLLLYQWAVLALITSIGLATFNGKIFAIVGAYFAGGDNAGQLKPVDLALIRRVGLTFLLHMLHFLCLSMIPTFFVYTMWSYRAQVVRMRRSVESAQLNELTLYAMKQQLSSLAEHFNQTLGYFSLPLTLDMVTNALLIIGSCCFLMIHKSSSEHYLANIFDVGAFALVRLVVCCWAGNLATNAYQSLVRTVYEQVSQWSLDQWMYFVEIKQLGKQFQATIANTYTVRQSAILTMLGFALNYIVVLLQTENYGTSSSSSAGNSTTACNCSSSINNNGTL